MRARVLLVALASAAVAGALPGAASVGFVDGVIRVSADSDDTVFPAAAADASGRTVVVWREPIEGQRHVVARRVAPTGRSGLASSTPTAA